MGVRREERARGLRGRAAAGAAAAITVILAALLAWAAAPALSLKPYVPRPVEFELRDGSLERPVGGARASGVRLYRSRVISTPKRFNLVGLRWRGGSPKELAVRVRRSGGAWSRWAELEADADHAPDRGGPEARRARQMVLSDPLWAGEADQLQYRIRPTTAIQDVALHFVNTRGTATPLDRARTGLRRAAHRVFISAASLLGADAQAAGTQPSIITREQWGASACPPRATPAYGEVKLAFVHHTVTANEYGPGDSAAMVLAICRYHRNSNRWNDIGYQFLVDRYGQIFEGRAGGVDQAVVGAQAQGYNSVSTGIASLGTFSTAGQTEQGLGALAALLGWKLGLHGVDPHSTVVVRSGGGSLNRYPAGKDVQFNAISGHRDGDATSCPGDGLYSQLGRLRDMVTPDPRPLTRLGLAAARARITYGRKARLSGTLRAQDGHPAAGQRLSVRSVGIGGTGDLASATTDGQGNFALNLRLSFNRTLQAAFSGGPVFRPSLSPQLRVGVRPRVTASLAPLAGARIEAGRRVLVTGLVRPRKRTALLIVDRRRTDGSFRRVAKQVVRLRRGRARVRYRLARPGVYRLRLGVDPDGRNLGARSEPIAVTAG